LILPDSLRASGIAAYKAEFFNHLAAGKQALGPLLRSAMSTQFVSGEIYQGLWCDIGTPKRLEEIRKGLESKLSL